MPKGKFWLALAVFLIGDLMLIGYFAILWELHR